MTNVLYLLIGVTFIVCAGMAYMDVPLFTSNMKKKYTEESIKRYVGKNFQAESVFGVGIALMAFPAIPQFLAILLISIGVAMSIMCMRILVRK